MVRSQDGPCFAVVGNALRVVATGDQTGGTYALFEFLVPPGAGAPPHLHTREDEAFTILAGALTFVVAGQEFTAGPGDFVHAPRDLPHSYQNRGAEPVRMTVLAVPAGVEKFFVEASAPLSGLDAPLAPPGPEDIQRVLDAAPKYGLQMLAK